MTPQESAEVNAFIKENSSKSDRELYRELVRQGINISMNAVRLRRRSMGNLKDSFGNLIDGKGLSRNDVKLAWLKGEDASILVHNPDFNKEQIEDVGARIIEEMKKHAPKYPKIKRAAVKHLPWMKEGHLLVVNMADIHVGENTELVIKRCHEALDDILIKATMFPISKIVFAGGNDVLHVDTDTHTTTKGTQLHAEMRPEDMFVKAKDLYIALIEKLVAFAPVHYVHIPDNHAKISGFHLSQVIEAWFHKHPEVTVDVSKDYRKRLVFGDNLVCFAHGHGVKDNDRPLDFATVFAKEWGLTRHRYGYLGHIHHNKSIISKHIKEMPGIEIQWLRSIQPQNDYESLSGYHSKAGVSLFIHHPKDGQVARFNKNF
jgi:hypothetical protein